MTASRRVLAALGALLSVAVFVPAASADISPTLKLDQSAGTQAGSTVALGTDITFAPSNPSTDSVKNLTEVLPAGLLSDASIDGGACIKTAPPSSGVPAAACQIGTGQATIVANGALDEMATLALYLVAPPQSSDLAGIAIYQHIGAGPTSLFGTPGDVAVRPSSDPAGVGIDISFTNIPDSVSFGGTPIPISLQELQTTISAIRMPTSCPSTPASYTINANSYSDPSTEQTASGPLSVTGCSSLTITPTFTVSAVRDPGDPGVQVTTDLQQPATPDQATSSQVVLSLPPTVLGPNVPAVVSGGILCADPTFASCKTIGTASSTSPLYPTAPTGNAYLTGSLAAPQIALVFPPPFPITLSGAVDITKGTTTFTGVPDLPLTDLQVVLAGGPNSVFTPSCNPASGTASAALTSQNGDLSVSAPAPFTVSNCPPPTGPTGSGGSPPTTTPPVTKTKPPPRAGRPRLGSLSLRRLAHHRFALRLSAVAGTNAKALKSVTVALPARLRFVVKRGHRLRLRKLVGAGGAGIASVRLAHRRLVIRLRHPVRRVTVSIRGLSVPGAGGAAKRLHSRRVKVVVSVTDTAGKSTRFPARTFRVRAP